MNLQEQIKEYIASQPELKRNDMQALHHHMLQIMPGCKLWFLDGKNSENKVVFNPNIGYGFHTMKYAVMTRNTWPRHMAKNSARPASPDIALSSNR
jgi:hypothetical protein